MIIKVLFFIHIFVIVFMMAFPETQSFTTRVIGGTQTTIENFPVVAQLLLDAWGDGHFGQYCAGVILTTRHILSVAHCFQYNKETQKDYSLPNFWKVRVGSSYRSQGGARLDVSKIITHPSFVKDYYTNDVSVVIVANTIPLGNRVKQATITKHGSEIKPNTTCTLIGWGSSKSNDEPSEQLLRVKLMVIDHAVCSERYKTISATLEKSMMCAGRLDVGGADGCHGDSGGPLICNGLAVGLVSFGYACGNGYYPGVYTKLSSFTDWILKTTSSN